MYTNNKEQLSILEAYRRVHLNENEELKKKKCHCEEHDEEDEKCDDCKKEKVKEESYLREDAASSITDWLKGKLSDLARTVQGLEVKGALYIDKVLGHPELKAAILKQQEFANSHDMKEIVQAHNMKLELNELAGEDLIDTLTASLRSNDVHALHKALKNQLKQTEQEIKRK